MLTLKGDRRASTDYDSPGWSRTERPGAEPGGANSGYTRRPGSGSSSGGEAEAVQASRRRLGWDRLLLHQAERQSATARTSWPEDEPTYYLRKPGGSKSGHGGVSKLRR